MPKLHFSQKIIFTVAVLILLGIGFYVYAWTDPGQAPPDGSVPSLLDSGAMAQTKTGSLNVLGNVGIGTAEPKVKLEVAGGDILASGAITANGGGSENWNNAYSHTFDNTGNVHGAANVNAPNAIVRRDENGNFSAGAISANLTGAASQNLLKAGDTLTGTLVFSGVDNDITTGINEDLSLLPNGAGKVGIGTAIPASKLTVAGMIESTLDGFKFPDGTIQTTATISGTNFWESSGNNISNTNTGNVGIGATNPQQRLEISGGVRLNSREAKPACRTNARGTIWFTKGGFGSKDTMEICAKDAANTYAWRTVW